MNEMKPKKLARRIKGEETVESILCEMMPGDKEREEREEEPILEVDISSEHETMTFKLDTYHYLSAFLKISDKSREVQDAFDRFYNKKNQNRYSPTNFKVLDEFTPHNLADTYNRSCMLSRNIRYTSFPYEPSEEGGVGASDDYYSHDIIMVQVLRGKHPKGGRSATAAFELDRSWDYFELTQCDVDAKCERCDATWWSDDCGYTWYDGPKMTFSEDDKVLCGECEGEINFTSRVMYY